MTERVLEDTMKVSISVIVLLFEWLVIFVSAHFSTVVSVENSDKIFNPVEFAFGVVEEFMHDRHNCLAHHR